MTSVLLFADFETTGLSVPDATLLEGAWALTHLDGSMIMPMRHRYLAIHDKGPRIVPIQRNGEKPRWENEVQRCQETEKFARRMAEKSLLFQDYLSCDATAVLRTGRELERLLLDDILAFCEPEDKVHICGAGAARFDYSLLALHCPRLITPPGIVGPVHYRPVDTSGNMTGLLGNNYEEKVIEWYLASSDDVFFIALANAPQYNFEDRDTTSWLMQGAHQHRAAPDVARAIVVQRALWAYGTELRRAVGVLG